MDYLMADIHADLRSFKIMLRKIRYDSTRDRVIIIGDVLDRNSQPLELLQYIKNYLNDGSMVLLKGNHELFCEQYLDGILEGKRWDLYGGTTTRKQVDDLCQIERHQLQALLKSLPHYMLLQTPEFGEVVLTHSGIDADYYVWNENGTINVVESIKKAVKADEYRYLISMDIHNIPAAERKKLDRFVICGHVGTYRLNQDGSYRIYKTKEYMDIDSGCGHRKKGGRLACYCVDTGMVEYI